MAEIKLDASRRTEVGKGPARRARAAGLVPATVYGRDMDPVSIAVDRRELVTALHTEAGMNVLLDLRIDGQSVLALTRELQRDPVRGRLLHADFVKVDRTHAVEVDVPVHIVGEAIGVQEGGVLEQQLHEVHVRCLPTEVPDAISADVSTLAVGDALRIGDLTAGRGFEILGDTDAVVVLIATPVSEEELEAMEAGAGIEQEVPEEIVTEEAGATEVETTREEPPETEPEEG